MESSTLNPTKIDATSATEGQVLTVSSGVPGWEDGSSGGVSLSNIYVVTSNNYGETSVFCDQVTDIVLSGGCHTAGSMKTSYPINQLDQTVLSGWGCTETLNRINTIFVTCYSP